MAPPAPLDETQVVAREQIPGGWYHALRLRRGQALRLVNTHATPGVSVMLWNAADRSERLSVPDTIKVQWTARVRGGQLLLSDMGRVLAAIVADDCGWHDGLLGGSTPASAEARYGRPDVRNTRDNLLRAAGKHGLDARDLPACFTFFAPVQTETDGRLRWREDVLRPGQAVDLVAAMDVLVAISNCPHPLHPGTDFGPAPVEAIVWQPGAAAAAAARAAGPEAERAYDNTDENLHDKTGRPHAD